MAEALFETWGRVRTLVTGANLRVEPPLAVAGEVSAEMTATLSVPIPLTATPVVSIGIFSYFPFTGSGLRKVLVPPLTRRVVYCRARRGLHSTTADRKLIISTAKRELRDGDSS